MKQILIFVLILVIITMSCSVKESDNHDHSGHDHGEVKLQLIEYTNQFELFAEADPFSKGNASEILTHFTSIPDFKPLTDASVTAILKVGSSEAKQTVENSQIPGIFRFSLKPEENGSGKLTIENKKEKKYIIEVDVVVYADEHTAVHIAEEKQTEHVNAINFTKEQSWKIDFATEYPTFDYFGKVIKTSAQLLPNQSSETLITAKTNGVIKFHKNILEEKKKKSGESLLTISGKGLASDNAEVRFLEAKNNFEAAKADYDRKFALSQNQIVSEKELEESKVEFQNAKAVFENLRSNFNENGQVVFSPEKGTINHVYAVNGQYVEAGEALFSICKEHKLVVKAEVQQRYFPYLSSITSFNIKSSISNKYYSKKELNGKLLSFGKHIDGDEGYLIPVNFQIDDNESLLTGSFVEIIIKTKAESESLLVPNTGLLEEQGNYFVLVQRNPETFEKVEVKVGVSDGVNTEILSGISKTDRIVTRGAVIVKLAAVSNSLDPHSGHVH